jgi:hypothetical protein
VDERDKDLTHLFVRDLDEISLPPRGEWRRPQGRETFAMRTSRYLLTAGLIVVVLAVALIVGFELRDRPTGVTNPSSSPRSDLTSLPIIVRPSPTANPNVTPTPCVGSTCPGGPPPNGAVFNDDFGFIVTEGATAASVRRESSSVTPWIGAFEQQGFAVSPDGTLIAYWAVGGAPPAQLRIVKASNPDSLLASSALRTNERGGGIVWSGDSSGIAYAVNSGNPTTSSTIRTWDVRSGGPAQVVLTSPDAGKILQPIAWNRGLNLVAGGVTGDGGFMTEYFTIDTVATNSAKTSFPVPGRITMGSVHTTNDTKFVLGIDVDSNAITWWVLTDFAQRKTVSVANAGKTGALWRPGTHDLGFINGDRFVLYNADQAQESGGLGGVPTNAFVRTFRADGNAIVFAAPVATSAGQFNYTLVLLGKPDPTPGDRVTFTDAAGLSASVRIR